MEPTSPALAGRFLTTGPPGKSPVSIPPPRGFSSETPFIPTRCRSLGNHAPPCQGRCGARWTRNWTSCFPCGSPQGGLCTSKRPGTLRRLPRLVPGRALCEIGDTAEEVRPPWKTAATRHKVLPETHTHTHIHTPCRPGGQANTGPQCSGRQMPPLPPHWHHLGSAPALLIHARPSVTKSSHMGAPSALSHPDRDRHAGGTRFPSSNGTRRCRLLAKR